MDDIYRFLTGEPDTVPEFHFNWMTVPRVKFEGEYTSNNLAPNPAQYVQQPPVPPAPPHTPPSSSSTSSPYSSPMPPTSGMWPQLVLQTPTSGMQVNRNTSGALTSGTCPVPQPVPSTSGNQVQEGPTRNLRQLQNVDYKQLHMADLNSWDGNNSSNDELQAETR